MGGGLRGSGRLLLFRRGRGFSCLGVVRSKRGEESYDIRYITLVFRARLHRLSLSISIYLSTFSFYLTFFSFQSFIVAFFGVLFYFLPILLLPILLSRLLSLFFLLYPYSYPFTLSYPALIFWVFVYFSVVSSFVFICVTTAFSYSFSFFSFVVHTVYF